MHRSQGFHIITANLAGYIAVSAHLTFKYGFLQFVRYFNPVFQQGQSGNVSSACRIGMEMVEFYARAAFGKSPALD
jgi:hypothetical protein